MDTNICIRWAYRLPITEKRENQQNCRKAMTPRTAEESAAKRALINGIFHNFFHLN